MSLSSFLSTVLSWLPMWQHTGRSKCASAMPLDDGLSHIGSKDEVEDAAPAAILTEEWVQVQVAVPVILPPHVSHSAQRPQKLVSY